MSRASWLRWFVFYFLSPGWTDYHSKSKKMGYSVFRSYFMLSAASAQEMASNFYFNFSIFLDGHLKRLKMLYLRSHSVHYYKFIAEYQYFSMQTSYLALCYFLWSWIFTIKTATPVLELRWDRSDSLCIRLQSSSNFYLYFVSC